MGGTELQAMQLVDLLGRFQAAKEVADVYRREGKASPVGYERDGGDFALVRLRFAIMDATGTGQARDMVCCQRQVLLGRPDTDPGGVRVLDGPAGREIIDADENVAPERADFICGGSRELMGN